MLHRQLGTVLIREVSLFHSVFIERVHAFIVIMYTTVTVCLASGSVSNH